MTVGNVNSAPQQDYKITAQGKEEIKTLREQIKAEVEEKEKAGAAQKVTPKANGEQTESAQNPLSDRVEISAEGRAKAEEEKRSKERTSVQPTAADPDEEDKKTEPEDDKDGKGGKKVPVGKSIADDSQWQAEIAKIKQKQAQLLQQIGSAGDDEEKRKKLEAQLALTEAELAAKDTDAYRKAHTKVTSLGSEMMDAADAAKLS